KADLGGAEDTDTSHCLTEAATDLSQHLRVVVVYDRLDDGIGSLLWGRGFEYSTANKHTINPQLHHERCISRRCNTTSGKVHYRQPLQPLDFPNELQRCLDALCKCIQLGFIHGNDLSYLAMDLTSVSHSLDNVARSRFTFCSEHCSALTDSTQTLAQVAA